jgi:hypothetical protein
MNKPKDINKLSYKELGELYLQKSKEIESLEVGSINYNFAVKQLQIIEDAIDIKSGSKSDKDIFIKLTDKARELGVSSRTIKNWITEGKVEGKIVENKQRKTWFVTDNIILKEVKKQYVKRERDSKGHFTKDGGSNTEPTE